MGFRSGLEEKVADLMVELGVKYEYESTRVPYEIQFNYTPDSVSYTHLTLPTICSV